MGGRKFSLIDIETTGGSPKGHRITEIAIINHDGEKIEERFSTLLNPECSIPYYITRMTGISNEMVADAPKFWEVAKKIVEMTEGRVFVAHNVRFDYEFIKKEFNELGYQFQKPLLCTVRLGRKIIPGHKSYSLGKICDDLGFKIKNRHRAMGDCEAMTELFEHYLSINPYILNTHIIEEELKKGVLPPELDPSKVNNLPEKPGVYYFYNNKGEVLYVGKSNNISRRVKTHLRADVKSSKNTFLRNSIADVSYTLTGNETLALLLENQEIKNYRPAMNSALKKNKFLYGLFLNDEPLSLELCLKGDREEPWMEFLTLKKGQRFLENLSQSFALPFHPEDKTVAILPYQWEAIRKEFQYPKNNCLLLGSGREKEEDSFLWIENGAVLGYGFFNAEEVNSLSDLKDQIEPLEENPELKKILIENFHQFDMKELPKEAHDDFY